MGANVFANELEVSCERADNQSLASMPDVCLSPPSPPAGPVPIPYPNFSSASDTTDGTKTVQIAGGQVGMKNQSCYKQSKGDEAATKSLGMGVSTGCIQGKNYFSAWSSDVQFEGANAVRLSDLTGSNSQSPPNAANATVSTGSPAPPPPEPDCVKLNNENEKIRKNLDDNTVDKTLVGAEGEGEGTTVASCQVTSSEGTSFMSAHNNQKATERASCDLSKGGSDAVRSGKKSTLCGNYTHPRPTKQKSGHSEARMFDESFAQSAAPSQMVFNIDWRPKSGGKSKMPCPTCHNMMCKAQEECDVKIFLCDAGKEDEKPQAHEVPCPADADSYSALKTSMGETVTDV
ncbi:MAG: DUF4150 domain-containing protein [Verrucomicrobia bacterium]|nr:DUF4150 domain-containing protein [Verrucomicrobiota bacterium]